jgi:hypothetical protein
MVLERVPVGTRYHELDCGEFNLYPASGMYIDLESFIIFKPIYLPII